MSIIVGLLAFAGVLIFASLLIVFAGIRHTNRNHLFEFIPHKSGVWVIHTPAGPAYARQVVDEHGHGYEIVTRFTGQGDRTYYEPPARTLVLNRLRGLADDHRKATQ